MALSEQDIEFIKLAVKAGTSEALDEHKIIHLAPVEKRVASLETDATVAKRALKALYVIIGSGLTYIGLK